MRKMAGSPPLDLPLATPWKNSCLRSWYGPSGCDTDDANQGHRQEFFQKRVPGGSEAIFSFLRGGGGLTPLFGRFNGQNKRIFGPGGAMVPPCQ